MKRVMLNLELGCAYFLLRQKFLLGMKVGTSVGHVDLGFNKYCVTDLSTRGNLEPAM
jgi:hypothetical protein